jgi:hypothetical protein
MRRSRSASKQVRGPTACHGCPPCPCSLPATRFGIYIHPPVSMVHSILLIEIGQRLGLFHAPPAPQARAHVFCVCLFTRLVLPAQPNPTQPNPTQPNPTHPLQESRSGPRSHCTFPAASASSAESAGSTTWTRTSRKATGTTRRTLSWWRRSRCWATDGARSRSCSPDGLRTPSRWAGGRVGGWVGGWGRSGR